MTRKYWVPALGKANLVLQLIAGHPSELRLMDLSKQLDIHKSSMFSLLQTMEELNWIHKEKDDTFSIGSAIGSFGSAYFQQFDLIEKFRREAVVYRDNVGETLQIARREGSDCFYMAKLEAPTPVRLHSEPGMRYPCHATALGKALLSSLSGEELKELYPDPRFRLLTPHTLPDLKALRVELEHVKTNGYACEEEEAAEGFCCASAPVYGRMGEIIAAVSFSIPSHRWREKKEQSIAAICQLGKQLSFIYS